MSAEFAAYGIARELLASARLGVEGAYRALERALRAACDQVEGVTGWRREADRFKCVFAGGERFAHYHGAVVSALDPASPLVAARRDGAHRFVARPLKALHPGDGVALAIPLLDAEVVAYIALTRRPAEAAMLRMLGVCEVATHAIGLAYDRDEDRTRATFDALTGLLSPRAFRIELAERLRVAQRRSVAPRVAVLFIDTDRFKEWNDRYGHAAGDRLLRELAVLLRSHANGPEDLVARNGGDEFCLVWADCEKSTAIQRAQALRVAIASAVAGREVRITASIGVAAFPVDALTPEALLEAADAAMYASKKGGRDRVSWAGCTSYPPLGSRSAGDGAEGGFALP